MAKQSGKRVLLGVNIDHVATLRQVRGTRYPEPLEAVFAAERGGADGITVHLREDRRHIQLRDVEMIQSVIKTRLNLEMAPTDEMVACVEKIRPAHCCLVPEKRAELTTEGGLDLLQGGKKLREICDRLQQCGTEVSLFIDPDLKQVEAAASLGIPVVEIHTGGYADAVNPDERQAELQRVVAAVTAASAAGLVVNAGHGLNYQNVQQIACIPEVNELNIGHAIIAHAIFAGLEAAVREMKQCIWMAGRNV